MSGEIKSKKEGILLKKEQQELPYEKFLKRGPESLSDTELLAIIIRTGIQGTDSVQIAEDVLKLQQSQNGLLSLHHLSIEQLISIKGIGQVKAVKIKCLAELSNRLAKQYHKTKVSFTSPLLVANYYMEQMRHLEEERVLVVLLDGKNNHIGEMVISIGTVNASLVSPREIFIKALKNNAVSLLILHNHPSGDSTPSKEDILMTKRMLEASKIINIPLVDHIIIGDHQYTSFKEKGLI